MDAQLHASMLRCKKLPRIALKAGKIFAVFSFLLRALTFAQIPPSQANASDTSPPTFQYWHVWTDTNGVSRHTKCEMRNFVLQSMELPAAPQWQDRLRAEGAEVIVTVQPTGWVGMWHENPKPQWIIPLSGRWFVETMDGTRVEMGPGEISFGEDQNTKPNSKGEKGHLSGTVGNEPAVLMVIQLNDAPTVNQQCHFK
jgi:hypothetical protein